MLNDSGNDSNCRNAEAETRSVHAKRIWPVLNPRHVLKLREVTSFVTWPLKGPKSCEEPSGHSGSLRTYGSFLCSVLLAHFVTSILAAEKEGDYSDSRARLV